MAKPKIDLLLRNVRYYNAFLRRFIPGDVSISNGRFFTAGQYDLSTYEVAAEIDGQGRWMIPGLIDIHLHVESSLVTPLPFGRQMVRHGVTTVVADPHEIANVFGLEGIEAMIDAGEGSPCDIFYAVPSCVPATPLETAGAEIGFPEFESLIKNPRVLCLGEVMGYVQLVREAGTPLHHLLEAIRTNHPRTIVEGHCPFMTGIDLATFIFHGPDADHTQQSVATIDDRIRNGMMVQIQEKSITPEVVRHLQNAGYDEHICLVTDDVAPDKLMRAGHLDYLIRRCVELGLDPEKAIYWTTYTSARRMGLGDRGAIAPGKLADFVLLDDLEGFLVDRVFKRGRLVHGDGLAQGNSELDRFPAHFYQSVKLRSLTEEDFILEAPVGRTEVTCRVIETRNGTTMTEEGRVTLPVREEQIHWDGSGCALAAVFHRHGRNDNIGYALVTGIVNTTGALATTYAHDNHNLLVIGHSPREMALAANRVIANQGGLAAVKDGCVIDELPLPIAGLMAHDEVATLAQKSDHFRQSMESLGYRHDFALMSLATLPLAVSPKIKVTDLGIVDVLEKKLVPLIVE